MECESEEKISHYHTIHWQVEVRKVVDSCQSLSWPRNVAAILFRILSDSTCGNTEILGDEVLPKKVF